MRTILSIVFCFSLALFLPVSCKTNFGYISYSSFNIGDDIQALAAKRFLPKKSIGIDREFIGEFRHHQTIKTIMNGWYMHTKDYAWYRSDIPAPEKSWPPAPSIKPLLISIHFTDGFLPYAFSDEAVAYLKKHGPVGARDYRTLHELQKRGIPSYFSGCLTLTLENDCTTRDDIIYAVDIDQDCIEYIKSKTSLKVEPITHSIGPGLKRRLRYAKNLLDTYKRARCVVTSRLHATMPCLAFQTPVLLIGNQRDPRFDGLRELVRNCSKEELLNGSVDFDFDNPSPNPADYRPIRDGLINIVTNWVHDKRQSGQTPLTNYVKPPLDTNLFKSELDLVDCVYVINLNQRPEKWERVKSLFQQRGINVNRVSAINGWELTEQDKTNLAGMYPTRLRGGQVGCLLSHVSVIHDAYQRGFNTIWVCEDDIEFCDDIKKIPELLRKLTQLDPDWDMLYTDVDTKDREGQYIQSLGSDFRPDQPHHPQDFYTQRILIDDDIMQIRQRFGMYSVLISRQGMKKILDHFKQTYVWAPVDVDIHYVSDIREYSATQDIVSIWCGSHVSDTANNISPKARIPFPDAA